VTHRSTSTSWVWAVYYLLGREGHSIGRRHVSTLMTRMGIEAVYRKPHTSQRHPAHPVYPYLLCNVAITRSNHVWAADINAPCRRGWRKTNYAGWLLTGNWNAAPLGKDTERKGAAKLHHVPMAGCHKQSSLNSTGRGPLPTSRATTGSMVRQRSVTCRHGSPPHRQTTARRHLRNGTFCPN
jgi:hypothetical protein